MKLHEFFALAVKNDWVMSWAAWKTVVEKLANTVILDDDSGLEPDDTVAAPFAKDGVWKCTVMPLVAIPEDPHGALAHDLGVTV